MSRASTAAVFAAGILLGAAVGWVARPDAEVDAPTCPPCPDCPVAPPSARGSAGARSVGAEPVPPPPEPRPSSSPLGELAEIVVPEAKRDRLTTGDLAAGIEDHPAWGPDWPADLAPAGFRDRAASDLKDCEGPFTYLGTDCEEPPCSVVFTGPVGARDEDVSAWLASCTAWAATYGSTSDRWTRCSRHLRCSSGEEVTLFSVAPQRALDLLEEQGFAQMDLKALQQQRCDDATALFECP